MQVIQSLGNVLQHNLVNLMGLTTENWVGGSAGILLEHSAKEKYQGPLLKKIQNCFECPFLQMVRDEEGEKFILNQNDAKTKQA